MGTWTDHHPFAAAETPSFLDLLDRVSADEQLDPRRKAVFADTPRIAATSSIRWSLSTVVWRSRFIGRLQLRVRQPLQVLARRLTRQQADERRDRSVDVGCAIRTLRRLGRRLGPLR